MTNALTPGGTVPSRSALAVAAALRWAWICWGILLLIPFLFLQWIIWHLPTVEVARPGVSSEPWFIGAMIYLICILPVMFFWRGRLFKHYWLGRPVAPARYIVATATVGLAMALGGIISLIGCLASGSLMPNLLPAIFALLLFGLHWPTGRAMVQPNGHTDDPQIYEEPR